MDFTLLKHGDRILFHTKGFSLISIAIRNLTESYWNHAGGFVREGDKGFIIEALGNGVCKTPIEKYIDNKSYDLKVVRIKESAFKNLEEYERGLRTSAYRLHQKIGKKYDYFAIVYLAFKFLFLGSYKKVKKFVSKNPLQSRQKFFCSELVCEADYNISSQHPYLYKGKTNSSCDTTTPKDIGKSPHVEYITGIDKL